jgi:hypothetical protein
VPILALEALDAPDEVAEQLEEIARALSARWLLGPAQAASVVGRWVDGADLHAESNWVYLHELPEYWAGLLFHRFVLHDDGPCEDECGIGVPRMRRRRPRHGGGPGAVLLLGTPTTSTAELLAQAAARRGLEVRRVSGPADLAGLTKEHTVHWYGGPAAARRVVAELGIGLLQPDDDWLPLLGRRYTGRRIESATLADARKLTAPAFVKPPSDKSFPAGVYLDGTHLPRDGQGLTSDTRVLISEVVDVVREYRLFVLDGEVRAASRYAVHGRLEPGPLEGDLREREARAFAAMVIRCLRYSLPSAVVVDIGLARDPGTGRERWIVVEANMAWFANCYTADPDRVLDVVLGSAGPLRRVAAQDFGHLAACS